MAPAVGVLVAVGLGAEQQPPLGEVGDEGGIGLLTARPAQGPTASV